MAPAPVVLILGAGPRVGASVAQSLASRGYHVAIASRKGLNAKNEAGYFSLRADFTKPETIPIIFAAVKAEFGVSPSVIVYNAASLTPPSDKESVLSISSNKILSDLNVNTISPFVAAQEAVRAWETLPSEDKKTFIYTGNVQNAQIVPVPMMLDLGMGKAASAYWIGVADTAYEFKGYR